MKKEKLIIEGMTCHHCVMALKKELTDAHISVAEAGIGFAEVEFDEQTLKNEDLTKIVAEAGYKLVRTENLN